MGHKSLFQALCTSTAIIAMAVPAQAAQVQASADLNLPAQDLGKSLRAVARATNSNIVFDPAQTAGKNAPVLKGRYSAEAAAQRLLAGSGLAVRNTGTGSLIVSRVGNGGSDVTSATSSSGKAALFGTVVDRDTGAALKGALVEIPTLGRTTSTDDLGQFRFPGLRAGEYDVHISYLGYREVSETIRAGGKGKGETIALVGGTDDAEIVVYGQRSARAQALNQERTAENSTTVISADLLGQFDGTTISESLRRAPGVAFTTDSETGDGANIIVRGLGPDLNTVTLNGQRLPVGNGVDRSPTLNNILTESVSKITINKTLLPNQDGSGTGGLVEIETKGPLDRPHRYASVNIEGARTGGDFIKEYGVSGVISGRFGASDNFGLSASVQYRNRRVSKLRYRLDSLIYGQYLPLNDQDAPYTFMDFINPTTPFPFEEGVDEVYPRIESNGYDVVRVRDLSVNVAAQWEIGTHTNLRLDYTRADQRTDAFTRTQSIYALSGTYEAQPIAELGGEIRSAFVWENASGATLTASHGYGDRRDQKNLSQVLSFTGNTNLGNWNFGYTFGAAKARTDRPAFYFHSFAPTSLSGNAAYFAAYLTPEALNNTLNGRLVSPFGPRRGSGYAQPLLTDAGYTYFNDPANYELNYTDASSGSGKNNRYTAKLHARRNFSGDYVKYVEAGIFYENSRQEDNSKTLYYSGSIEPGLTASSLGLTFSETSLGSIGVTNGFDVISSSDLESFSDRLINYITGTNPPIVVTYPDFDERTLHDFTNEKDFAAYLQGRIDFGLLEIVGGARMERVRTVAAGGPRYVILYDTIPITSASDQPTITKLKGEQTDILPRVSATWRRNANLLFRFGYYTSIARPQISQLNQAPSIVLYLPKWFGPNRDQPGIFISEGNPDLKPSYTDNYDASVEYYDNDVGSIKVSGFYKRTKNLIFSNTSQPLTSLTQVELPDHPFFENVPDNVVVQGSRPENSPYSAKLWGIEASVEKHFSFLPGALSGLGVYANYTYTHSEKTETLNYYAPDFTPIAVNFGGVPYPSQPKHSGTAALTYNKYGFDMSLAYSKQSRFLSAFSGYGLSRYQEAIDSLDFHGEYRFGVGATKLRIYVEATDILKGRGDPRTQDSVGGVGSTPKYITGAEYFGGRSFRLGLSATF